MSISAPRTRARARSAATSRTGAFPRAEVADIAVAVAVAGALLALTLSGLDPAEAARQPLDLPRAVLACATAAPLAARRRSPWAVFLASAAASVAFAVWGVTVWLPVGLAAALYVLVSRRGDNRGSPAWTPAGMTAVASLLTAYLAATAAATFNYADLFHATLAFTVAWFAGERTRLRRAQLAEFADRAARAEQAAVRERELAVAEERARIARDLHDSAAHALNVITVRAGAARLRRDRDPDRDLAALVAIEELARQTVADIDHFVGALRSDGTAVEAPPGLAALDALVAQHRAGGHTIEMTRTRQRQPLAVPVEHGTYRIVQEALTNATRYGTGAIRIELAYLDDALHLTVSNAVAPAAARTTPGGGHGLIGMRERLSPWAGS
ncbi:histidine kinase [Streptomyces sp. NBC_00433]